MRPTSHFPLLCTKVRKIFKFPVENKEQRESGVEYKKSYTFSPFHQLGHIDRTKKSQATQGVYFWANTRGCLSILSEPPKPLLIQSGQRGGRGKYGRAPIGHCNFPSSARGEKLRARFYCRLFSPPPLPIFTPAIKFYCMLPSASSKEEADNRVCIRIRESELRLNQKEKKILNWRTEPIFPSFPNEGGMNKKS